MQLIRTLIIFALALGPSAACAAEGVADVQRLQQQRDQQQMELRLNMQQQQDRALRPAPNPSAELHRRQLERDQRQRQRQTHDQQSRAAIVAPAAGSETMSRELENARSGQTSADQLRRYELERRIDSERMIGNESTGELRR